MALDRPTYLALLDRYIATVETKLPGADARLPGSDLNVSGHVLAEVASGLYDFGLRIADQILPDEDTDYDHLVQLAADWAIYPQPAVAASGTVLVTRTGIGDIPVAAGTILQAGGLDYVTLADAVVSTPTASLTAAAVIAGAAGNLDAGVSMALVSPIAGLSTRGVSGGFTGGVDKEGAPSLLSRLRQRRRRPPHGGCPDDYERWAREVAGITRAWVYRATPAPGLVTVLVVRDGNAGGPIPAAAEIAAVQAYIDRPDILPVCAECVVRAPDPVPHDLLIAIDPNTAEVQAAIAAAVRAWYRAESEPGIMGARSRLSAAISAAAGEIRHKILAPATDQALTRFQMAVVRSITFEAYA